MHAIDKFIGNSRRTRAVLALAILSGLAGAATAQTSPLPTVGKESTSGYRLTFQDEFVPLANGDNGLNSAKWNTAIWYETPHHIKNYGVRDSSGPRDSADAGAEHSASGVLRIWPQPDGNTFVNRTLDTDGSKFTQTYGFFEMRARLPYGQGPWPAFWLFNHIGRKRPEIDIMEAYPGAPVEKNWSSVDKHPINYGTTVWRDATSQAGWRMIATGRDLYRSFNVYGVKWDASNVTFYFNGSPVYSVNVRMRDPLYVVLSLWYGSESGTPDVSVTPIGETNAFEIDYVRVWQLPRY